MAGTWNPVKDIPDMQGKVAVVTGGNSGIGLHTVKHLAAKGARVYFTARSKEKADQTRQVVAAYTSRDVSSSLIWVPLDLSDLASVMQAAAFITSRERKVDILINNAGQLTTGLEKNAAGWEMVMAVCHVGHFVLTNQLLPLLENADAEKNSDVRIVTISSNVVGVFLPHDYPFAFTSTGYLYGTQPFEPWKFRHIQRHFFTVDMMRYSLAKAANMIFARELQRRLDERGSGIISMSVHPGGVKSDAALAIFTNFMKPVMRQVMVSEDQGSFTTLFAAAAPQVRSDANRYKGSYIEPVGKVTPQHPVTNDKEQTSGLWDTTTAVVSEYLAEHACGSLREW